MRRMAPNVNLPNLITVTRILLVPLIIWLIVSDAYGAAFLVFILAGASDAVDGFLAKRYGLTTEIGAYLDPLADKLLLVSIYLALGVRAALPAWLVILVVSRDVLIVAAVLLAWIVDRPVEVQPVTVSKVNTVCQIVLAGFTLAALGAGFAAQPAILAGSLIVAALTVGSGAIYIQAWLRHMANHGGAAEP
jgi:cardiolipin synthase